MKIFKYYHQYPKSQFILDTDEIELVDNKINFLLGDNGCGKSSLFKKIIANETEHESCSVIMMLQKPYLFNRTVYDNIQIVKKAYNADSDIETLLDQLDLMELAHQSASSLSGGQKQRLAFAMTLAAKAKLVLLDEPFNNVDFKSYQLMISCLKKQSDTTFFIISHQVQVAKKIGSYFVLMDQGRVIFQGDKETFKDQCSEYIDTALRMV